MSSNRLVQIQHGSSRHVARVEEPRLRVLHEFNSVFALATAALESGRGLAALVASSLSDQTLDYDAVYTGSSEWRLLSPIDHPHGPGRCLVSGTGLTHLGSAKNRAAMHGKSEAELTDSMKMFRSGLEGGRPTPGQIGSAPEWFLQGPWDHPPRSRRPAGRSLVCE